MRRRDFIKAIAGSAGTWPLAATAQQSTLPIIGFLGGADPIGLGLKSKPCGLGFATTRILRGKTLPSNIAGLLLAPISPTAAFPHDRRPIWRRTLKCSDGHEIAYIEMLKWIALATVCGLPATAVPAGLNDRGLPVGVQIIGPRGGDVLTLAVAQAIDEQVAGFRAPPLK